MSCTTCILHVNRQLITVNNTQAFFLFMFCGGTTVNLRRQSSVGGMDSSVVTNSGVEIGRAHV